MAKVLHPPSCTTLPLVPGRLLAPWQQPVWISRWCCCQMAKVGLRGLDSCCNKSTASVLLYDHGLHVQSWQLEDPLAVELRNLPSCMTLLLVPGRLLAQ